MASAIPSIRPGWVEELPHASRGEGGFGWDALFIPDGSDRTFAEMSGEEKDRVSHRRRAWEALAAEQHRVGEHPVPEVVVELGRRHVLRVLGRRPDRGVVARDADLVAAGRQRVAQAAPVLGDRASIERTLSADARARSTSGSIRPGWARTR